MQTILNFSNKIIKKNQGIIIEYSRETRINAKDTNLVIISQVVGSSYVYYFVI